MRKMQLTSVLAISLLVVSPGVPVLDWAADGAAFANGNGNGGGGGNGGGNGGGGNGGGGKSESKKSEKASGKSEKSAKASTKKKPKAAEGEVVAAKGKATVEGELAPNELGKMNGAMNANINAVLAHIRNGQITKGPVGLMAGLAVADAGAAAAKAEVEELKARAEAYDKLDAELEAAGYASPEEYLEAKANGEVTEEDMAAIDPLIEQAGGTTEDGLAMAEERPDEADIAAAEEAAAEADLAVDEVEAAIGEAWNKDGDLDTLLGEMRAKLAANKDAIDAAIAESNAAEETAAAPEAAGAPGEEVVVVIE